MKKNDNKKITIGLFNDSFYPMADGVIMVMDNYARRLAKIANVIVFVPSYKGKEYDDSSLPYKVVRCKSLDIFFLDYSLGRPKKDKEFMRQLEESNLDIVHIHSPFAMGKVGVEYAKRHNIPCIATMHAQFEQDFYKELHNHKLSMMATHKLIKTYEKCDECWAVNKEVARIFHEDYGYSKMPRVMDNATEMKPVKDLKKAIKIINEKHNLKDDEKVFLFVGRINTLKNILFIVEALDIVKKANPKFKFKMLFVGSGRDEDKLKEHIEKYNLNDDVILVGRVMDRELLEYYYARADLFLFPSIYDASSIVQIEASSQKTPAVFLEDTATSATVTNDVNGFITKRTIEDFAKKIIDVMEDEKFYKKVSENSYKDLYHNWDDVVNDVYDLYLSFINNNKE